MLNLKILLTLNESVAFDMYLNLLKNVHFVNKNKCTKNQ
jgi:hypothetical protein